MDVTSIVPTKKAPKTSENVDECDTNMGNSTRSESSSKAAGVDDYDAIPACDFCDLVITRRCAEVQQYGELRDSSIITGLKTQELRRGAREGCQDCDLMNRTVEHFCTIGDGSSVSVCFDMVSWEEEVEQLRIDLDVEHGFDVSIKRFNIFSSTADVPINPRWSTIGKRPLIRQDTSSEHSFQMVSNWLHDCSKNHSRCHKDKVSCLPKRVLEITKTTVFLREYVESGVHARYACLSHCWGKQGPALQLRSETTSQLRSGIARAQLPRTFKDAMEICERLGIYFLWIDAMCIRQDSLEDWESEAAVMAEIYKGAYLTIAATGSGDSDGGCFSKTRDDFSDISLGTTGLCARRKLPKFPKTSYDYDMTDWPLLERGWVFQERLLSTRIIHYAKDQIFWECTSAFLSASSDQDWNDDSTGNPNPSVNVVKHDSGILNSTWRKRIEIYSKLDFTKISDRLPALGGVVKREMERRDNDTYVAGMWQKTLLEDLSFTRNACYGNLPGIPSWSWACHGDVVKFGDTMPSRDSVATTELITVDVPFDEVPHMGKAISASIRLKSPTLSVRAAAYLSAQRQWSLVNGDDQLRNLDYGLYDIPTYYDHLSPEAELLLIVMSVSMRTRSGSGEMLVLERLPTGNCLRIGYGRLYYTRTGLNHMDPEQLGEDLVAENMKRFLAFFKVQEVEII